MKKKHAILYDSIVQEVNRLSDSQEAELFAELLEVAGADIDEFVVLTERLRGFGADLAGAKARREHFANWADLRSSLEDFFIKFSAFPNLNCEKRRLELILATKLAQIEPSIDMVDIDDDRFELRELSTTLPIHLFVHENNKDFSESVVVISIRDAAAFEQELAQANISPKLSFQLLAAIQAKLQLLPKQYALIKRSTPAISDAGVEAFCCLSLLSVGRPVHVPRTYELPPRLIDCDRLQAGVAYNQMNEIMYVLSEYNSHRQVLSKYLTLYHVVENFMYRMPIAKLEQAQGGAMFSIRDFQRLYKEVEEKEMPAIRKLFAEVAKLEYEPGKKFRARFISNWTAACSGLLPGDIQVALGKFGVKRDGRAMNITEFTAGDLPANFAQLVYGVRCAIVHNKETEFHLTYANLDDGVAALIEKFLIPTLEEVCFHLVSGTNSVIWYANRDLKLFE